MAATATTPTESTHSRVDSSRDGVLLAKWRCRTAAERYLTLLLIAYVVKQVFLVLVSPPFTGHDEVAHYSYIRTMVEEHHLPRVVELSEFAASMGTGVAAPGDYFDTDLYPYCRYVLDWFCDLSSERWRASPPHIVTVLGQYYPSGWQYVANHPPGYYAMMAPLYWATDRFSPAAQQYVLRGAAIPFGVAVVVLSYLLTRLVFPRDLFLAMTVPTFVAFQPQVSYEAAMVNNDIVGIAIISLVLYLLMRGIFRTFTWKLTILIGVTLGVGLLIKSTTSLVLPAVGFALLFGVGWREVRQWLPRGIAIGALAGLIAAPWYYYLHQTYGNFSALDQIAANQWAWTYRNKTPPTILGQLVNPTFIWQRWRESWGEFGWRLIRLGDPLLIAIMIPTLIATAGLLWYGFRLIRIWRGNVTVPRDPIWSPDRRQIIALLTLALTVAVSYFGVLQFGTRFVLTQARYFFPAINAFALLLMLGLRAIVPIPALRYVQGGVLTGLVFLTLIIYTVYVIPFWHLAS